MELVVGGWDGDGTPIVLLNGRHRANRRMSYAYQLRKPERLDALFDRVQCADACFPPAAGSTAEYELCADFHQILERILVYVLRILPITPLQCAIIKPPALSGAPQTAA